MNSSDRVDSSSRIKKHAPVIVVLVVVAAMVMVTAKTLTTSSSPAAVATTTTSEWAVAPPASSSVSSASPGSTSMFPRSVYRRLSIEPPEQRYLRSGTDFATMIRETSRSGGTMDSLVADHHAALPTSLPLRLQSSNALAPIKQLQIPIAPNKESDRQHLLSLSAADLRRTLKEKGASCEGCLEKLELVERVLQVRGWASFDDVVAAMLSPYQFSAGRALTPVHLGVPMAPDLRRQLVEQQTHAGMIAGNFRCVEGSDSKHNATRYCTPLVVG